MDLWTLTARTPRLDANELAKAIEQQVCEPSPDYRTRLLIHDAARALEAFWGQERYLRWLEQSPDAERISALAQESFPEVGFPSLKNRLEVATRAETIRQYLRDLGTKPTTAVRVVIGGSSSLILLGLLQRHTEDIDLVDEVPEPLRRLHSEFDALRDRYGLVLAHFQSHYLPEGWSQRLHSLGNFARIEAHCVDPLDVATGKLMSRRTKDLEDLRVLSTHFGPTRMAERLELCRRHLEDPEMAQAASENYYVLFGQELTLND